MLTTKEFMDKLKELNLITELDKEKESITVYKRCFPTFSMVFFHVDIYGTNVNLIGGVVDSKNVEVFKLLSQYLDTPDEDRMTKEYYYIYWSDVCGGEFFLDHGIIDDQEYFSFETCRTFNGVKELEEDNGTHYLKPYQFTEDEVKSIPARWRPSYFGGIGFTEYVKVKDDKVAI